MIDMRRVGTAILIVVLLLAAFGVSRGILRARLLELRISIQRDQILRYELSSRLLRYRFQQMLSDRENIGGEIKLAVLESQVVNDLSQGMPEPGPLDLAGTLLINSIRTVLLKPRLALLDQRLKVLRLNAGFYHERSRNCPGALKQYGDIDTREDSADSAFVLLHSGYCLAVTGKTAEAIRVLEEVEQRFPGTHFERSASEILKLLRAMKAQVESAQGKPPEEAARILFEAAQYAEVDRLLSGRTVRGRDKYILARSKEETGQVADAAKLYREIKQENDPEAARNANRRMLLMGTVYNQGSELAREAETDAARNGDSALVQEVGQAVRDQKPAEVLRATDSGPGGDIMEELRKEVQTRERALSMEPPPELPPPEIRVLLTDGRSFTGTGIAMEEDRAVLVGSRPVAIPTVLVATVEMTQVRPEYAICAVQKGRKVICGDRLLLVNATFKGETDSLPVAETDGLMVQKRGSF